MSNSLMMELGIATLETLYMVFVSGILAAIIGIPLGFIMFGAGVIQRQKGMYRVINIFINIFRSIPFIILLVLLIPVTRLIVGTSIGSTATIVPLTIAAIPFLARLSENILLELPYGLIEAGFSIGASPRQILWSLLLPDAKPALVNAMTVTLITLIAYSAMAGAVGGGGLGDLAIRYGYQRFEFNVLILTVIILVLMVQALQSIGDMISKRLTH